jgi:hypothetical protein
MKCSTCGIERIARISGKTSDMFSMDCVPEGLDDYNGYVPNNMNIGGGDYIEFDYCLNCGQIQGNFPVDLSEEAWE